MLLGCLQFKSMFCVNSVAVYCILLRCIICLFLQTYAYFQRFMQKDAVVHAFRFREPLCILSCDAKNTNSQIWGCIRHRKTPQALTQRSFKFSADHNYFKLLAQGVEIKKKMWAFWRLLIVDAVLFSQEQHQTDSLPSY